MTKYIVYTLALLTLIYVVYTIGEFSLCFIDLRFSHEIILDPEANIVRECARRHLLFPLLMFI